MTFSAIMAGIAIAALAALIELNDREYEEKKNEFENS